MKLQFDPNQPFQLDAVAAVTDHFDGQPEGPRQDVWRVQIKHTIKKHLEKERAQRGRGIKVLGLRRRMENP
ncbi:MAG: hypothetical protein HY812_11425 [Planctomycetes bacterium]|nr:hypothetical protein [Planctomycetota bacterium]